MQRAQGFAQQGSQNVWTAGHASATLVQETAPFAMILVYVTGTTTLATIFGDNNTPPTPLANPFTANDNGYWYFYAADGRYDVMIEAENWTWTIGDLLLGDHANWTADQDTGGHWINNLGGISFSNDVCYESISLDPNCNLLWLDGSGNTTMSLSPQGDLAIPGRLKVAGIDVASGACSASIGFDSQCNIVVTGQGGNPLVSITQQGNLDATGCLTASCLAIKGDAAIDGILGVNGQVNIVGTDSYPSNCQSGVLNILSTNGVGYIKLNVTGSNPNTTYQPYTGIEFCNNGQYVGEIGAWKHNDPYSGFSIDVGNFIDCIFVSYDTGFVGINTGNPSCQLTVNGDLCVTGNISASGSVSGNTVNTCHIGCPGTLLLDAPAVNIPNTLYVNGIVVNGIPLPPPPAAGWNAYTPQLWDASFAPIISDAIVIGRYSVWGSWMVLAFGIQFNPQGYNQAYFHIGLPPGLALQASGVGLVFTCYFNNAPGLTPTIADLQATPEGNVIRVATLGSTTSEFMQMSLQGILEVEGV